MTQKGGKILMWLLSWGILALVIIYSPIGSPDLYTQNKYIVYNQGVNFNNGIANAPKTHNYGEQYEMPDVGLPTYTPEPKNYSASSAASTADSYGKPNQSTYSVSTPTNVRTSVTGPTGGGGGGIAMFSSGRSSQNSNQFSQNTGMTSMTLSTDLSTLQSPAVTTKQSASAGTLDGGTDPGGDPTGPPIPVGDGYWSLLSMVILYTLFKRKSMNH